MNKLERFHKKLVNWSVDWVGIDGKIGYFDKFEKIESRLDRMRNSFKRNIVICHPEYKEDSPEISELETRSKCFGDACAVSEVNV